MGKGELAGKVEGRSSGVDSSGPCRYGLYVFAEKRANQPVCLGDWNQAEAA